MHIEKFVLAQPRRSKKINANEINIMDGAHDPYGHGEDAMGGDTRDP